MKKGFVLEGGAMRGLFTAGVMDAFLENDIVFDGVIGVSAGAVFGCNYLSKQKGRVLRYNTRFCREPAYCSLRSLIKTGDLYGREFCYEIVPESLEPFDTKTFTENPGEFWAVATDVDTGEAEYRKLNDLLGEEMDFLRASASMPIVSKAVEIGGHAYLDGGISDSIPLKAFQERGYERNVVVLTQPKEYVKGKMKLDPMMKAALHEYPAVYEALKTRPERYNEEKEYVFAQQEAGNAYVIYPPYKLPIGKIEHDANKMRAVYDIGFETGKNCIDEVKQFLNE